jgi:hypothetical protein
MEHIDAPHPDFQKGFNEGYTLTKHMPDVSDAISRTLPDSERGEGFKAGREQYEREVTKSRAPSWLNKDRLYDLDDYEDLERDIDKDEPER